MVRICSYTCLVYGCHLLYLLQVNKIVQGQFTLFQSMYKPFLEEFAAKDLLRFTSSAGNQVNVSQVCTDKFCKQIFFSHSHIIARVSWP